MIEFILHYSDKSNIQQLEIEIINNNSFINDSYIIDDSEAKEIYLLISQDKNDIHYNSLYFRPIQDYLTDLLTIDDSPYSRGEN